MAGRLADRMTRRDLRRMTRLAKKLAGPDASVEDLVSTTCEDLVRHADDGAPVAAWAYHAMRYRRRKLVRDNTNPIRKPARRNLSLGELGAWTDEGGERTGDAPGLPFTPPSQEDHTYLGELAVLLAAMPARWRDAVILVAQGYSYREISARHGTTPMTAFHWYRQGRGLLADPRL